MPLTTKQAELFQKLIEMPRGTILRRGNRERILVSFGPGFVFYKIKSKIKETIMIQLSTFMNWAENAEIVELSQSIF